ncbi:MAG: nuclear transport factor 2 family protein [Novosphingobium sp.]|nr:nuclear transport factor 2 family protein [Novosphingobium sp.]
MNFEHVSKLMAAFSRDVDEAMGYYHEDCDFADHPLEQYIARDKAMLRRAFVPFANKDPNNGMGVHTFEALEYLGDENAGLLQWRWTADNCGSIFGLPNPEAKRVSTNGMSYYQFCDGKIIREVVHSNQVKILKQLGYPVEIIHFWE